MMIPRILLSVNNPKSKWSESDCLTAILDTGSSFNILHQSALPSDITIDKRVKTSLRAVNGTVTPFVGTAELKTRLLHPITFQPMLASEKIILFHITDSLPVSAILGMPYLCHCTLENDYKRVRIKMKSRILLVPYAEKFALFSRDAFLVNENERSTLDSHINRNLNDHKKLINEYSTNVNNLNLFKTIKINKKLPKAAQEEICIIIENYKDVFQLRTDEGSLFKNGNHKPLKINLSSRVYQGLQPYPIPETVYPELEKQLGDWLKAGIIERAKHFGEFLSPLLPVPKKSGETRFCLDTRAINAITVPIRFNPPRIMDLVRKASGYKYYTCLDIASFFLSFKLDESSRPLVSFQSPIDGRVYQFKVSIFGLRNSMENSLILLNNEVNSIEGSHKFMINYVDDVCIFHDDLSEHLFDVERVLRKLRECNLKLKPSKVEVAVHECDLFGFRLSKNGFTVSPDKKEAILKIPEPKTQRELETILGKASYYRNLLPPKPGMGYFTSAFRDLRGNLEKGRFKFTDKHKQAFADLKKAMYEFTLLQKLLPSDQHIIVRSDASDSHWAGSLSAVRHGKEIHIFHVSKAFAGPAIRYAICRKELIGALMTLYEFRNDIHGREKVELHVDNASSYFLLCNPEKVKVDSQVFQNLFYNVRYLKFTPIRVSGKDPNWALIDRLSRIGKPLKISSKNVQQLLSVEEHPVPEDLVCIADLRPVKSKIDDHIITAPLFDLKVLEKVKNEIKNDHEFMTNNTVPDHLKHILLRSLHQVGHIGSIRMASILTQNNIVWKNRNKEIDQIVRQCQSCSTRKPSNRPINVVTNVLNVLEPKYCVSIDISTVGQPAAFHTLVMVDEFTHFVSARRIHGKLTYINIANTLIAMLASYAPMCKIVRLDNASYFNEDFKNFLTSLGIKCSFASRGNSRSNGRAERNIQSISSQFKYKLEEYPQLNSFRPAEIDLLLETVCLYINMTHKVHGITPYALTYGRTVIYNELELPSIDCSNLNTYEKRLTDRIKSLQQLIRIAMDQNQKTDQSGLFKIGDLVRIRTYQKPGENKLQRLHFTSQIFEITSIISNRRTYKLQNVRNENDIRIVPDRHTKLVLKREERDIIDSKKASLDEAYNDYKNKIIQNVQTGNHKSQTPRRRKPDIPEKHIMTLRKRR